MPMSTCGSCKKIFSSTSLFDAHRVGSFGEPMYTAKELAKEPKKRHPYAYGPPARRCMTTEELETAGYTYEHKQITVYRDGKPERVGRDVWYDPKAREIMRAAFAKDEDEDTP